MINEINIEKNTKKSYFRTEEEIEESLKDSGWFDWFKRNTLVKKDLNLNQKVEEYKGDFSDINYLEDLLA